MSMFRRFALILIVVVLAFNAMAQDTLPKITVTQLGRKALVSWKNHYSNITSINIQRSDDSLRNFRSIGSVLNVSATTNGFVDPKEFLPNLQYYRLFITFEGGTYFFTASHRPGPDTMRVSLTEIASAPKAETQPVVVQKWFIPSPHVYTGKDNNIIISLPDTKTKNYTVKFFEDDNTFLFEIKKVAEDYLILDKVNFLHSGLFRFEVYENKKLIEKHKVYIPKDGQATPLLDADGYEVRNGKSNRR